MTMPVIKPRRPRDPDKPEGDKESDVDFVLNNVKACAEILDSICNGTTKNIFVLR